ncbi:MAG: DUF2087 domain-containing protein [Nakamurella sp.]
MSDEFLRAAERDLELVRRRFFDDQGRLLAIPRKQSRQLAAMDHVVQRFVPGVRYTEPEVNIELMSVTDDYVTVRRALIDFSLMSRADGCYWRSGGSVDLDEPGDVTP